MGALWRLFYTRIIVVRVCMRASVLPQVALTLSPWLAFRSTKNPGYVGDGKAESTSVITVNNRDV